MTEEPSPDKHRLLNKQRLIYVGGLQTHISTYIYSIYFIHNIIKSRYILHTAAQIKSKEDKVGKYSVGWVYCLLVPGSDAMDLSAIILLLQRILA